MLIPPRIRALAVLATVLFATPLPAGAATSVEIEAKSPNGPYGLRASGRILKFAGWLATQGEGVGGPMAGEEEAQEPEEKAASAEAENDEDWQRDRE